MRKAALLAFALLSSAPRAAFAADAEGFTPAPAPPSKVRGLVDAGASTTSLFGLRAAGAHVAAGVGVDAGRVFLPIMVDAEIGRTPGGLGMGDVTLVFAAQAVIGPVRIGGGGDVGYAWITRAASSTGGHIGALAADVFALATVDLFAIGERGALYLGVKPSVGVRWGESIFAVDHATFAIRGAALAGVRF